MTPAASLLIVAYNGAPFVRRLLDSVRSQTFKDFETILVDNASKDDTVKILEDEYPEVTLVKMGENLHFARGNNEGYRRARAPVVVLLNQDTWVGHDWLERLLAPLLEAGGEAVACTHAPILNEGTGYEHSTAHFALEGRKLSTLTVAGRNCGTEVPLGLWNVFYGSGAGLAVRKSAAGERLFDPDYVAYAEDVALGWRLRIGGGKVRLVPEAAVHHALPPEGRPSTPDMLYLWERNRLFTLYVHYTARSRWLLHPVFAADVLALALRRPARVLPDGSRADKAASKAPESAGPRGALYRAVIRAMLEALARRGDLARKHREVEARRKGPESSVTRAMTARLTPFDEGWHGRVNRFSSAWCRAFGVVTVEEASSGGPQ